MATARGSATALPAFAVAFPIIVVRAVFSIFVVFVPSAIGVMPADRGDVDGGVFRAVGAENRANRFLDLLLGAAAGALFGVSDIAIKFLAHDIASGSA